jgi:hypothetical protein
MVHTSFRMTNNRERPTENIPSGYEEPNTPTEWG